VALRAHAREAQDLELAGGERPLERLELARVDAPVGHVRLDPVAIGERPGELAQAPHPLAEHDHLLLGGHPGERLGGHAAQQRQPVPTTTHSFLHQPLADERGRERRLRVRQRLPVNRRVDEHADVSQHDSLRAGELGQRVPIQLDSGFEGLELAEDLEQPPVGLASAMADGVEQLLQGWVGVERERLRRPNLGHPRLHVAAGDADEVRSVVDAKAVGVDLVHQVAGLAGVEPLGDHRLVSDREADEHVEVLGALSAWCRAVRSQQSATDPNRTWASAWCASVAGLA
jgi:hypothetical protein